MKLRVSLQAAKATLRDAVERKDRVIAGLEAELKVRATFLRTFVLLLSSLLSSLLFFLSFFLLSCFAVLME